MTVNDCLHGLKFNIFKILTFLTIVSEYDQEIPQSQTADNPVAPREKVKS